MEYEECLKKTGLGTQGANIIEVLKIMKRLEGLKQEDFEMELFGRGTKFQQDTNTNPNTIQNTNTYANPNRPLAPMLASIDGRR